jgi:photoactive yellow protein
MDNNHDHCGRDGSLPSNTDQAVRLLGNADLDHLNVGVIGFDQDGLVRVYNRPESVAAGLSRERILGKHVFESVAPCMNNFLVAQRFADAATSSQPLDVEIDYVLTLRMKPTAVRLRLLWTPLAQLSYIVVHR